MSFCNTLEWGNIDQGYDWVKSWTGAFSGFLGIYIDVNLVKVSNGYNIAFLTTCIDLSMKYKPEIRFHYET